MTPSSSGGVPEIGQLIPVRQHQRVVADVDRSSLHTYALSRESRPLQQLLTLSSIEDALGDEIQVVWEIEPGARILEEAALPRATRFHDPERLEAFLHAVRLDVVTDADHLTIQSPFRSGVETHDFELDPVVHAMQMPGTNLLIADDVGPGKTIGAGLVHRYGRERE